MNSAAPPRPWWHHVALAVACTVLVCGDVLRLGFFADDFQFLDAVRHHPLGEVLLGRHGIWPWYRPLAREGYFLLAVAAGPQGLLVARIVSLVGLAALALGVIRLGGRLVGPSAARAACIVLVTYSFMKFLVGWASGFQDLLATTLTVWAVERQASGRPRWAAVLVGLAPFAKETGLVATALVWGHGVVVERRPPIGRWVAPVACAALAAVAIHLAVRATWPPLPPPEANAATWRNGVEALRIALAGFVTPGLPPTAWGWIAGGLAGALVVLLALRAGDRVALYPAIGRRGLAYLGGAVAVSLAPMIATLAPGLYGPSAYFATPAAPWLSLLLGSAVVALPRAIGWGALALLATINVWGLAYRAPNLDAPEGWEMGALGWREAVRIEARAQRLADDLRVALASRPESLVILYEQIPSGSWIQTGDGPAAREILGDPRVRAYFLNRAPVGLDPGRVVVISYDPIERHGFVRVPRDCDRSLRKAVNALVREQGPAARVWSEYGPGCGDSSRFARYVRAAAALIESGDAAAFARELEHAGLLDTTGVHAASTGWFPRPDPALEDAYRPVMARPRSAAAHGAAAELLAIRGAELLAALELRLALALGSRSAADAYRLGVILARNGLPTYAREALRAAVEIGRPAEDARRAAELIPQLAPEGQAGSDQP